MALTILGIRHHGVGSAKKVRERLEMLAPDMIMVEGPPEISEMLQTIGHKDLKPPVSIMVYNSDVPRQSVFYPFAQYSPEWVAASFGNEKNIPVRAIDLPAAVGFQQRLNKEKSEENADVETEIQIETVATPFTKDPLSYLSEIAGFESSEAWWEYNFERNFETGQSEGHFEAVLTAMEALRSGGVPSYLEEENVLREAYMRELIRKAQNEMHENIVVVCGAWHAPELIDLDKYGKADAKLLKSLPKTKIKVATTWIPWTNSRLSMFSGYGAGVSSPGWYEHQWKTKTDMEIRWLTKVAQNFRKKQVDVSSAHIIETFRLAESLAGLRSKSSITLDEMTESVNAVMCMGDTIKLSLIHEDLIVGKKLGKVPPDIPKVPLQEDFERIIKRLRLPLQANSKQYDLDLRKDNDLERSILLHRLEILGINWAKRTYSRTKGTFKESWVLNWSPELMIDLIDKSILGNTIEDAATAEILLKSVDSNRVSELARFVENCIPAELFQLIDELLIKIDDLSTLSSDIVDLMQALNPLVELSRYGNVRKTDKTTVQVIVYKLCLKVSINLPNACYGLDEASSEKMFGLIAQVNDSIKLLDEEDLLNSWFQSLHILIDKAGINQLIIGCTCRLLLDGHEITENDASQHLSLAMSQANEPYDVAFWLEGFLRGSGMILIYDNRLWNLIYEWVASLSGEIFMQQLPFLRRTFSKFEFGERRQIGEKAKKGLMETQEHTSNGNLEIDVERAELVIPILKQIYAIS
jgi:hypothetical protein